MNDLTIIITEKKSVSKTIAKALSPDSFDDRGNSDIEHNDIILIRNNRDENEFQHHTLCNCLESKDADYFYFCSSDCVRSCDFIAEHIDAMGRDHAAGTRRKLKYSNEIRKEKGRSIQIFEDISYYLFDKDNEKVLIMDTCGNPLSYMIKNNGEKKTIERLVLENDFKTLKEKLIFRSNIDYDAKTSHKARERLFNNVLAKKKLPDGTSINIKRIIAATDYDIAGSYIFYSTIMNANQFIRKGREFGHNTKEINLDMLYRMKLSNMDKQSVLEEFKQPLQFDFNNYYAGELRSLFDFIYGTTISSKLNFAIKDNSKDDRFRIGVGRVKFLSLSKLVQQEQSLRDSKEQDYVYLIFNGLKDKQDIENDLASKDFIAVKTTEKKDIVSHSSFLKLLQQDNIGTHTTRYKQAHSLCRDKLAACSDNQILSTPFGSNYFNLLRQYIDDTDFSLTDWNKVLYSTMQSFTSYSDTNPNKRKWLENKSRDFIESFMKGFKEHLLDIKPEWDFIGKEIFSYHEKYARLKTVEKFKENSTDIIHPKDSLLLKGDDSVLSIEQIADFIDKTDNAPRPLYQRISNIYRFTVEQEIPYEDAIRRVCCIDRDTNFSINATDQDLTRLLGLDNSGKFTVFRAIMPDKDISSLFNRNIKMSSYKEMDIFDLPPAESSAHQPLQLTDISPSDMKGQEGFWLASEYQIPWSMTLDKINKKNNGLINLASFTINGHDFNRIDRYEFGKAHKFESLLTTMFEKYKLPFDDTADIAEKLYLGGD